MSCYGSARSYSAEAGSSASDINIKTNSTRSVRVCTHNKCHGWHKAKAGVWTVIFPKSTKNAEYYVQFDGMSTNSGTIAD